MNIERCECTKGIDGLDLGLDRKFGETEYISGDTGSAQEIKYICFNFPFSIFSAGADTIYWFQEGYGRVNKWILNYVTYRKDKDGWINEYETM